MVRSVFDYLKSDFSSLSHI